MLASFSDKALNISGAETCSYLTIKRCMYFFETQSTTIALFGSMLQTWRARCLMASNWGLLKSWLFSSMLACG